MKKFAFLFFNLSILLSAQWPVIKNLNLKDFMYQDLMRKIKAYNKNENVPLFFYSYEIKKGDTFFKVVSKVNGWQSSILTLNKLNEPLLNVGDKILIASKKGVFVWQDDLYRLNSILISTRDLESAEELKIKDENGVERVLYFFDFQKDNTSGSLSSSELLFFLNTNFMFPLREYKISSGFGKRRDPINGKASYHPALDLASPYGTPVYSASQGEVVKVSYDEIYGNFIVIRHNNNLESLYGHLSRIIVRQGQVLFKGELIGEVGESGRTTGPHLHFEIKKNNKNINPSEVLK